MNRQPIDYRPQQAQSLDGLPLFAFQREVDSVVLPTRREQAAARDEQAAHLERVSERIAGAIVAYCRARVGRQFVMDDLRSAVAERVGPVAPDSPGRILRQLKQARAIDYAVVSRRESLYEVLEVAA